MKYQTKTRVVEAITFDELVEYGRSITPPNQLMNGMPWAFEYKGHHVTHENDTCYLILGLETDLRMTPGDMLILGEHGEIWTCMHDTFEATYEPAETAPQSSDAAQSKWQPIATAPRDKPILISAPHEEVCAAEWTEAIKTAWWYPLGIIPTRKGWIQFEPTHWMALPEPPEGQE
jgi:hypothetical protein